MSIESILVIITSVLLLAVVCVVIWAGRRMAQEMSRINTSMVERFAQVQADVLEKVGHSNEILRESVQNALHSGRTEQHEVLRHSVELLERKFTELRGQVDSKLQQTFEANRRDLTQVTDRLAKLHDATGQIVSLSKGVNELHSLLRRPKLRGAFGEWALELMLQEILGQEGQLFKRQFRLHNDSVADAAVFTRTGGQQVVCVDAKFPTTQAQVLLTEPLSDERRAACLKQFRKDVLQQGKSIAQKYISPPQTLGFAFMYVPAESVFQLILQEVELHEKLLHMNVIPTSPNSFFAYLQSMAFALSGLRIQDNAREIQQQVRAMARDFEKFSKHYQMLGTHVHNAASKYDQTLGDVKRFQDRVAQVQGVQIPEPQPLQPAEPRETADVLSNS